MHTVSVAPQAEDRPPTDGVPEPNLVGPGRDNARAVSMEGQAQNPVGMPGQVVEQLSFLEVPDPDQAFRARGRQISSVRTDGQSVDRPGVPFQRADELQGECGFEIAFDFQLNADIRV